MGTKPIFGACNRDCASWLGSPSCLEAGTIGVGPPLSDVASSGISPSKTYTHAIGGGAGTFVNGVNFEPLTDDDSPSNFHWNPNGFPKSHFACCNNGDWDPASGGVTDPS